MKITYELDLENFETWSGAVETLDRIKREGLCEQLEAILDDTFPEGMSETELNDLLRFDDEMVFEWLGLETESQLKEQLEELESHVNEILEEFEEKELEPDERKEYWEKWYKDEYEQLQEEIEEVKEKLEDL